MQSNIINIMEVCGTHTMEIAKAGLKSMLPDNIRLISGPGCPVCVTPPEVIDSILSLSENRNIIIATYGDMMRVPGSVKGDNLILRRAGGANVEMVYSPMDALVLAEKNPDKEVVFPGVGFETTAPGTAACIKAAAEKKLENFSVFCLLKRIEPALRLLLSENHTALPVSNIPIDGLLCPGHVAVILGEKGFRFLSDELHIPSVIAGFKPEEILDAVRLLVRQIKEGTPKLENAYASVVNYEGNTAAAELLDMIFTSTDHIYADLWRGLGAIPGSGYVPRPEYERFDAVKKYNISVSESRMPSRCRCGDVICGRIEPSECPLFGTVCTPSEPDGPCMVSSEGACAAAFNYGY